MLKLTVAATCLALSACTATSPIAYNGDSVTVRSEKRVTDPEVSSEANRLCATNGRQAEYLSTTTFALGIWDYLFVCR